MLPYLSQHETSMNEVTFNQGLDAAIHEAAVVSQMSITAP